MAKADLRILSTNLAKEGWEYLYTADRCNGRIPHESGVYAFVASCVITRLSEIVYIGKSNDFSIRLKPWHKIERIFEDKTCHLLCYIKFTNDHHSLEIDLIKRYAPKYNVQHNPKIRRVITYV